MMQAWLKDMADEMSESKRAAKIAIRKSRVSSTLAVSRLSKLKDLNAQVGEVKDNLAEEARISKNLEKISTICQEMKKSVLLVVVAANLIGLCMSLCSFVKSVAKVPLLLKFVLFSKIRWHTSPAVNQMIYHR